MDIQGAINRLLQVHNKLVAEANNSNDLGIYTEQYETKIGTSLFFVFIAPVKGTSKGKLKDFQKVMDKAKNSEKLILPRDFLFVRRYLSGIYSQLKKPADTVLKALRLTIAGLRLGFIPYHNMKYIVDLKNKSDIMVYESKDGKIYAAYIHAINLKENGLILAHERQLNFLVKEIGKGANPLSIANLPALRTGSTLLQMQKQRNLLNQQAKTDSQVNRVRPLKEIQSTTIDEPIAISIGKKQAKKNKNGKDPVIKFREQLKKKKAKAAISQELEYSTVIQSFPQEADDYGSSKNNAATISRQKPNAFQGPFGKVTANIQDESTETQRMSNTVPFDIKMELQSLREEISDLKTENQELKNQIILQTDKLTKQLEEKDKQIAQLNEIFTQKESEITDYQRTYAKLVNEAHKKDQLIDNLTKEINDLKQEIDYYKKQKEQLEEALEKQSMLSTDEVNKYEQLIESLDKERNQYKQNYELLKAELNEIKKSKNLPFDLIKNLKDQKYEDYIVELFLETEMLAEALKQMDLANSNKQIN